MNYSKILEELFLQQEEYLGNNKLVNNIIPTVSVHVITYQHVNYIEDCLRGILMQKTNFPIEIVIGEDESEDGTRRICKKYAEEYPNTIRLFLRDRNKSVLKENGQTIYFNGKLTLKSCRGKYIAICEGDDYWTDPYKLQKQVDFLEANEEYGIAYTDIQMVDGKGSLMNNYPPYKSLKLFYKEGSVFWDLLQMNFMTTPTTCIRTRALKPLLDEISRWYTYDMHIWLLIAMDYKIKFINEKTAAYRKHEGGITNIRGALAKKQPFIYLDVVHKALYKLNFKDIGKKGKDILFYRIWGLFKNKYLNFAQKQKLLLKMVNEHYFHHFLYWAVLKALKR